MKILQVFDAANMPINIRDTIIKFYGDDVLCDSYHRWYPDVTEDTKVGEYRSFKDEEQREQGIEINKWLLKSGMVIDKNNKCFHVLFHINW